MATDCQGTYRDIYSIPDETGGLHGVRCDGCGDLLIVVKGQGFDFPAGTTVEEACRSAIAQATGRGARWAEAQEAMRWAAERDGEPVLTLAE